MAAERKDYIAVNVADILADDEESIKIAICEGVNKVKIIPLDFDGMPRSDDPYSELYDRSHPIATLLPGNIVDSHWMLGWWLSEIISTRMIHDSFSVNLSVWLTETNPDIVTNVVKGSRAFFEKLPHRHKYTLSWHTPPLISDRDNKDVTIHSDIKRTTDMSSSEWVQYVDLHIQEWFSELHVIIHNMSCNRVNKTLLLNQLLICMRYIKSNTMLIVRFSDARDWDGCEYNVISLILLMFGNIQIRLFPSGPGTLYLVAYNPPEIIHTSSSGTRLKYEKIYIPTSDQRTRMSEVAKHIAGYKVVKGYSKSKFRDLARRVHQLQVEGCDASENATEWSKKYIDYFGEEPIL
jgi:hypothetical protein